MIKIRVIGDSSSSGIGLYEYCYPYILSKKLDSFADFEVINYSVPALTSSDACRFYHTKIKKRHTDFLVLYLGHNEGGFLPYKGPYTHISRIYKLFPPYDSRRSHLTEFKIRNKYEFSKSLPSVSIANNPNDFYYNMLSILKAAVKNGTKTILINPVGNERYLSGVGSSNICYIKYINHFDSVGDKLISVDDETTLLIQAIRDQENGDFQKAIKIYERLCYSKNEVVEFVVKNNMAVCYSSIDCAKSEEILLGLVDKPKYYNSVVYANLSLLYDQINDKEKSKHYQKMSYENDFSLYRIRPQYREVIHNLSNRCNVFYIDLEKLLSVDDDFIDYCHPTYSGYDKIASAIARYIEDQTKETKIQIKSKYRNVFINPNYYFNKNESLVDYFVMDFKLSKETINAELSKMLNKNDQIDKKYEYQGGLQKNILQNYLINFINVNKSHPIFTVKLDLFGSYAPLSHEILNFPEFYIYRILLNYYTLFEDEEIARKCHIPLGISEYLFSSEIYRNFILRNNKHPLEMELNISLDYLTSIEEKIINTLKHGDIFTNTLPLRQKTIMYWYMREAFRYGSHSRFSVFYKRWEIDKIIEAVIVSFVIAFQNMLEIRYEAYRYILNNMILLLDAHEKNIKNCLINYNKKSLDQYETELETIKLGVLSDIITVLKFE